MRDELEEDDDDYTIEELLKRKAAIFSSLEKGYEYTYARLKSRWLYSFDRNGDIEGRRADRVIRRVIDYYEKKDTVEGYERCAVMMKLLEDYRQ